MSGTSLKYSIIGSPSWLYIRITEGESLKSLDAQALSHSVELESTKGVGVDPTSLF